MCSARLLVLIWCCERIWIDAVEVMRVFENASAALPRKTFLAGNSDLSKENAEETLKFGLLEIYSTPVYLRLLADTALYSLEEGKGRLSV